MKCSICKNEFGIGETCQHCGTDKVVALGNYNGYEAPVSGAYNNSSTASASQPKMVTVDSMVCHACGEIIPASSKFCPHCSHSLWVECPKCGKTYSSQYPACSECGTNRKEYIEKQQQEKRMQEMERRRYEEWLNSPEGQAEQKRKEKEDTRGCLYVLAKIAILCGLFMCLIMFIVFFIADSTVGTKDDGTPFYMPYISGIIEIIVGIVLYIVGYVFYRPRK